MFMFKHETNEKFLACFFWPQELPLLHQPMAGTDSKRIRWCTLYLKLPPVVFVACLINLYKYCGIQ